MKVAKYILLPEIKKIMPTKIYAKNIVDYLIIANLIALLIIPQLNNIHYDPTPLFLAEFTAAVLIISLFMLVCITTQRINIPIIILPLIMFALLIFVQPYFILIKFVGLNYIVCWEMFLLGILAISISNIVNQFGVRYLLQIICSGLLIGVILQSLVGLMQYSGLYVHFTKWILYDAHHPTTNIFGQFGQRNHYGEYLTWGVFALIYLYYRQFICRKFFYILWVWLLFSLTIAATRSVLIYFAGAIIITFIFYYTHEDKLANRKLLYLVVLTGIGLLAVEFIYPLFAKIFIHHLQVSSGLNRVASDIDNGMLFNSRRFIEWYKALLVFSHHPIFGIGWNNYAAQSVALQHLFTKVPPNSGLFTNSHNLILQLLAETGIIGCGVIVIGIIYVIMNIAKNNNIEGVIILCMIFTTLAHSMVEYPLWYLYFLAIFIIFLSMNTSMPNIKISRTYVLFVTIIPIMLILYLLISGVSIYRNLVNMSDRPDDASIFNQQIEYMKDLIANNQYWSYYSLDTLDDYITIDNNMTNKYFSLNQQIAYERQLTDFHPYPMNLIKMAKLEWNLKNYNQAKALVRLALIAFPSYQAQYLNTFTNKKYIHLHNIIKTASH
jgi:O-antigen ligase